VTRATALRLALAADAESIARLHAESWRASYRGIYRDAYLDGPVFEDRLRVWQERLAAPSDEQFVLLAAEGDVVIGFVCAYGSADARWGTLVDNLHVRRDRQRAGLGRKLLAGAARWSVERYTEASLYLWVLEDNTNARAFYESLGAEEHGRELTEAPGGGEVMGLRYVWRSLEGLT
jgi:ribosomal protein S18 acetylase RimI-like enzyme